MNILDRYYEKGIEDGLEKGIEKGIEKGKGEIVRNLIRSEKFTDAEIARLTGVSMMVVKKIKTLVNKQR